MQSIPSQAIILLEAETLRDGLQTESQIFSLEPELQMFQMLKNSGIQRIQVGSFAHPKIVPQMAETDTLICSIGRQDEIISALVLNGKGD